MAETVDELCIAYSEEGVEKVRELDKAVLSKGAWTTIAFLYQELSGATGKYGERKVSLRRYKKIGGKYVPQSKFNISSPAQGRMIMQLLDKWYGTDETNSGDDGSDSEE